MRFIRFAIALIMLFGVVWTALWVGMRGAEMQEAAIERHIADGFDAARIGWARAAVDGLTVRLSGTAPDAFARETARDIVQRAAAPARVIDRVRLAERAARREPLALTLTRIGGRLTVTGQVVDAAMRARLMRRLAEAAPGVRIAPLIGTRAGAPAHPPGELFEVAALAAGALRDARIEVAPGAVSVRGVVSNAPGVRALAARLRAAAGDGVRLDLDLAAPPPVVAPFEVVLEKPPGAPVRATACAARSQSEALALDAMLGVSGLCRHGLGGPAGDWPGAVAAARRALAGQAGRLRLAYRDAMLTLPAGTASATAAAAERALAAQLPRGYRARVEIAAHRDEPEGAPAEPARYWLHLVRRDGRAVIAGRMANRAGRAALGAFAAAGLGTARLEMAVTRADAPAPQGWQRAAFAAVEALARMREGEVALAPGFLRLDGRVDDPAEIGRLHRGLAARLPEHEVESHLSVDLPALVDAQGLTPARCTVVLNERVARTGLRFAPGSATIADGAAPALDRAAAVLRRCPEARMEIGGHTDSQGSAGFNRRLSRARAEAVRDALAERGIALARLRAKGYGESEPVASNDTPEGRARNRRIAFRMLEPRT